LNDQIYKAIKAIYYIKPWTKKSKFIKLKIQS
jgi:hypothetical protein